MGITRDLAEHIVSIKPDAIPDEAMTVARHCVLDWFGCALAGAREPLSEILVEQVAAAESGDATLVGRGERTSMRAAALINGAMSHALDYDDTHMMMSGHPSAPVVPAALALAEREGASGAAFLSAIVAGIETECRLGALANPGHYAAGFHATGTLGTFGAAAAAARLLALDAERTAQALALAGTQAAGLKSGFGTMAKPLHAGRAAENGLVAAMLAGGGFTGNPAIVEVEQGFAATHAAGEIDSARLETMRGRFLIVDTLFKYHASCYLTHAAIDASSTLRSKAQFALDHIMSVEVRASAGCIGVCDIAEPRTGLEGKFSLRATTAMALLCDDTSDPAAFSDARMRDPAFIAMRERVTFVPVEGLATTRATVIVQTGAGEMSAEADTGRPERDLERQWERLTAKFFGLASPVIGGGRARELRAAVAGLVQARSMRDVMMLVGRSSEVVGSRR